MRAAIILLVLLFFMCGALTRSTQTEVQAESQASGAAAAAEVSTQLDVSAELQELRDMVVDLKATLRYTQDDVKILEAENAAVKERLAVSETRVGTLERMLQDTKAEMKTEVDNLKKELAAQEAAHEEELATLKTRLAASEVGIDDLKVENAEREAEMTAVETRLDITESEVENLKTEIKAAPKVAFSAGLTNSGYIEAGNTDLNLVFSKVITNVGQAYSSTTGFFTAPVRGVYYFRFTVMDNLTSRNMKIEMFRNGKQLMWLAERDTDGHYSYLSSGLTLQLEEGDVVNMVLPAGHRLFDDTNNHNTFSGFLLFPL